MQHFVTIVSYKPALEYIAQSALPLFYYGTALLRVGGTFRSEHPPMHHRQIIATLLSMPTP